MKHHVCRPTRFLAAGLHPAALLWALSATQPWLMPQLPPGHSSHSIGSGSMLTPADDDEDPQVVLVGEEGHEDQAVQVKTFHQDPVVVGGQKIEEESHHHLAANLWTYSQRSAHIKLSPENKTWWLLLSGQQDPGCAPCMAHIPPLAGSYVSPGILRHQM